MPQPIVISDSDDEDEYIEEPPPKKQLFRRPSSAVRHGTNTLATLVFDPFFGLLWMLGLLRGVIGSSA